VVWAKGPCASGAEQAGLSAEGRQTSTNSVELMSVCPTGGPLRRRKPVELHMPYVYVLWSDKLRKRYVGCTADVTKRLKEHNAGRTAFTHRGIPWVLIHSEVIETLGEARKRERFLKSGAGRRWLDEQYPEYRRGARAAE
jgi:putative endonuclease